MPGHPLSNLELAAVLEVGGDAGGTEAVSADLGADAGGLGTPLNYHVHVSLGQASAAGQPAMAQGQEERGLSIDGTPDS